ncbi:MAG TPA: hypothetical protein VFQ76_16850, partial [Longimicrobiaceae bacterium]|nr:hypothetical protein [Longimicrobiaceae bacterium]
MAAHQLRQRPLQRGGVQLPFQPQRGGEVVGGGAAAPAPRASTSAASPASVGASKTACSGISTPNASRTRATIPVASSECPPSAKKSTSA